MKTINIVILNYCTGNFEVIHGINVSDDYLNSDIESILEKNGYDLNTIEWMELIPVSEFLSCQANANNEITVMYSQSIKDAYND